MKAMILLALLVCSYSPYSSQIHNLDKAYAQGRVDPNQYYAVRYELTNADTQWHRAEAAQISAASQQVLLGMAAAGQAYNQSYQNQQWLNAYNARTYMMNMPQQVNVNYSGTINHNINGTLYLQ